MSAHVLSAHVSTKRVQAFLAQDETDKYKNLTPSNEIGFRNATCTHSSTDAAAAAEGFALRDLDLIFPKGELSLVAGPVGSGKVGPVTLSLLSSSMLTKTCPSLAQTTLLLSLLGETVSHLPSLQRF
jgi:ABC-type multidrug transport system fused ATPase/permease subunit